MKKIQIFKVAIFIILLIVISFLSYFLGTLQSKECWLGCGEFYFYQDFKGHVADLIVTLTLFHQGKIDLIRERAEMNLELCPKFLEDFYVRYQTECPFSKAFDMNSQTSTIIKWIEDYYLDNKLKMSEDMKKILNRLKGYIQKSS